MRTVSLPNHDRLQNGKKPLGFLNLLLYSYATANAFTEIKAGNVECEDTRWSDLIPSSSGIVPEAG